MSQTKKLDFTMDMNATDVLEHGRFDLKINKSALVCLLNQLIYQNQIIKLAINELYEKTGVVEDSRKIPPPPPPPPPPDIKDVMKIG